MTQATPSSIDQTDQQIIASLASNGRRSFREIARELDVSESTVRQRVGRMVDDKLIRITVVGNLITLGFEVVAFVHIRVKPGCVRETALILTRFPNVRFVGTSFGSVDITIQTLHGNARELHHFVSEVIPEAAPAITSIETHQLAEVLKSSWTWGDWFESLESHAEPAVENESAGSLHRKVRS